MTHYAAKSEFQDCVKKLALKVKGIYCMIDHQAVASKIFLALLGKVLVKNVNFVEGGAFNSLILSQLCFEMDAYHHLLLYHTNIKDELKLFSEVQGKVEFVAYVNDEV
ncbi:SCAN domain-containing protein 3 [Trichinella spiralis]|uniref:SCAN domain-containing protein 3 n=1 Tax=Trichinella spiralis TaxID=6334 RepID=A0A0V1AR41_TRISP|nr:SCAN domain-containing protein 3 [Trichinella spiralis]